MNIYILNPRFRRIATLIYIIGTIFGATVFGIIAYSVAEHAITFDLYGVDGNARVITCEMVRGRSDVYPNITYQYTIDDQTYQQDWGLQNEADTCNHVSRNVSIVYLSNDPSTSIYGTTEDTRDGIGIGLSGGVLLGSGAIGFALWSMALMRELYRDLRTSSQTPHSLL